MRSILVSSLFMFSLLLAGGDAYAVGTIRPAPVEKEAVHPENVQDQKLTPQEKRTMRKSLKTQLKSAIQYARSNASDTDLLLLVIIAILLPPLAMFLHEGAITSRFWISLLLTLIFWLPGMIYTLVVILGEN